MKQSHRYYLAVMIVISPHVNTLVAVFLAAFLFVCAVVIEDQEDGEM